MKRVLFGAAGLMALSSLAVAADATPTTWFDETISAWRLSSTGSGEWITSAGRWAVKAGDKSSCSNQQHKVYLNTCGNEIAYRPCVMSGSSPTTSTLYSPYNTLTKVTVSEAVFTAFRGGDE